MCGINGFNFLDKLLIAKMNKSIAHRGPDQEGVAGFKTPDLSLGHVRLSIIDLTENGRQPMTSKDERIWIVFNGEIYNFLEVRKELEEKGYKFKSKSDTEVIIYSYKEWGFDCLEKFNGMFAFCIYDADKKILFFARDRLGIKPLYYYLKDGKIIFSSEIKGILEYGMEREIDLEALDEFISLEGNFGGKTLFKDIFELLPGYYMTFDLDKKEIKEIKQYWDISVKEKKDYVKDELVDNLKKSVKYQLMSDVPLGVYLSGGMDSSVVTSLASELVGDKLNAFTATYNDSEFSEEKYAEIMAKRANVVLHKEYIDKDDFSESLVKCVWYNDYPLTQEPSIPTYFLSKFTKKQVTVALTGEGGDELFLGYNRFKNVPNFSLNLNLGPLNFYALKALQGVKKASGNKKSYENMFLNPMTIMAYSQNYFNHHRRNKLYGKKMNPYIKRPTYYLSYYLDKSSRFSNKWDMYSYFELKVYLKSLLHKVDRMTMANAIESRVPFLDHNFVEYIFSLDPELKVKYGLKGLLKKSFEDRIPREILEREKVGFLTPMEIWIKDNEFVKKMLMESRLVRDGYLKSKFIEKAYDKHTLKEVFIILNLEVWYRLFILQEIGISKDGKKKESLTNN